MYVIINVHMNYYKILTSNANFLFCNFRGLLTSKNKIDEVLKIYCENIHILLLKLNCSIHQWKEYS